MTDKILLKQTIYKSGVSKVWLAKKIGISRPRLYKILDGAECTASEIAGFTSALRLTHATRDKIFFANKVV